MSGRGEGGELDWLGRDAEQRGDHGGIGCRLVTLHVTAGGMSSDGAPVRAEGVVGREAEQAEGGGWGEGGAPGDGCIAQEEVEPVGVVQRTAEGGPAHVGVGAEAA